MKIKEIKVFVCCPGRNFVTIKVITEDATYGIGDATVNGREMAVVAYLEEHVIPCLIGKDAQQIEDIWQYLYKGAYWQNGAISIAAISAIDMALWDIKGKIAGLPVYQLLGGKSRKAVTVYAHVNGETVDDVLNNLEVAIDQGYKVARLQCTIPGIAGTYGTLGKKKNYYELQGDRPLPPEHGWSTTKYLNFITELFKQARERFGYDIELCHDVHSRLTPIEAVQLGKMLEPYRLKFLEDPVTYENTDGYQVIRNQTAMPLALGEKFNTIWDAKPFIENQTIDFVRTAATHGGGITALKKLADFAALYHVRMAPHGAPDLSPICFMAHMHLDLWAPNFGVQEFIGFGTSTLNEVFKYKAELKDGSIHIEDVPGIGVDFDEAAAEKYPYKRSYLPVTRLEDGTLWSW
ncbi:D-galactonate dehydratase family protein [Tamlana haliotis]|uniref:D-galactonate dehydratase family protein n=1 Tax=Pseudotamlana haliotis TaxID=2614804 RepID=A0A6N6M8G5_9FLAO|nr:D-mannonate dehydratase ManD [Tamlana haliotis]KAB1066562.1 D-galactonate dehydratase family protein [Tamlana haliotis]